MPTDPIRSNAIRVAEPKGYCNDCKSPGFILFNTCRGCGSANIMIDVRELAKAIPTEATEPNLADTLAELHARATAEPWEVIESRDVFAAVVSPGIAAIAIDFENADDARLTCALRNNAESLIAALRDVDRLRKLIGEAASVIDSLSSQQAMRDDFYEETLQRINRELEAK